MVVCVTRSARAAAERLPWREMARKLCRWSQSNIVPGFANMFTQLPVTRSLAKLAAGVHSARELPPFAPETFRAWFEKRPRTLESPHKGALHAVARAVGQTPIGKVKEAPLRCSGLRSLCSNTRENPPPQGIGRWYRVCVQF